MRTNTSVNLRLGTAEEFGVDFHRNLEECNWEPHPLYSVFTQYDKEYYLARKTAFLEKYRCFYAVSKTISPKMIVELGTSAGAGADAYLSATPKAKYIGFDVFAEATERDDRPAWKPNEIATKLFTDRGFKNYELIRMDLRTLAKLPCRSDLVVVDGGHDFDNQYSDLRLALTADPDFIFVDDTAAEGKPAIQKFLSEDLKSRVEYTFPINYMGGGLVIKLKQSDSPNSLMTKFRPEVSVEDLKETIRAAVARRQAEGRASFINASSELFQILAEDHLSWDTPEPTEPQTTELASEEISLLKLQPEFSLHENGHYHVNDLLQYHDSAFIWNAYLALLKREPDEEGFQAYLELLRSGQRNKIDILASLQRSQEGKRAQVSIDGLAGPALIRRLYQVPIIGYLLELTVALVRLPLLLRSQRQMENHLVAQQDRVAGHFNYTSRQLADEIDRLERELKHQLREEKDRVTSRADVFQRTLTDLFERQQKIAELNHQQVADLFSRQQKLTENHRSISTSSNHVPRAQVNTASQRRELDLDKLDKLEAAFIDQMRGSHEVVKNDTRSYLPLLKHAGVTAAIVDLGCGRGEWLELLQEEGLRAVGVESNRTLVTAGRSRGLDITNQTAIEYLRGLANNSLQAITGFHLIEHLEFDALMELLLEAHRTLKPGGIMILETPNPKNLVVGACNFYADPTHHKPIFPETLKFLLDGLGFERVRIEYKHPVEGSPFDNSERGSQELHTWLFGPRDYAAIAWKA
ncbi:MAG: methyltransferase domain-containing protein [Pyrinomonadaceae bacterium]